MKTKKILLLVLMATCSQFMAHAQNEVVIQYNGNTASVSIPDEIRSEVTASVTGADVVINSATTATEYTYKVKGKSTDGSLTLFGSYKLTLVLAGIELTNAHDGPAINIQCGKRIDVKLMDGTVNTLADAAGGTQKAAFYFTGHVEFGGAGVLNVTGRTKHAISAKEEMTLKSSLGTINVLGAVSDGLHCGKGKVRNEHNYFLMKGGIVNIAQVGSDGVSSDDYGTIKIEGGAISMNVGDNGTGLKADSLLEMSGGRVSIAVKGVEAEGVRASYDLQLKGGKLDIVVTGNGSKGLKADKEDGKDDATVLGGGKLTISGGETDIQVLGGNYIVSADDVDKCMGISVDADMMQTDGTVNITALGKEARICNVKGNETRSGGSFETIRAPWTMDAFSYQYDMSAYVKVKKNNKAVTDYATLAVGAFVDGNFAGYAVFQNADFGIMRIRNSSQSTNKSVSFKLYDYNTEKEYDLTPATSVVFADASCAGTPAQPLTLSYQAAELIGDVNGDGSISVTDVGMMISYILGQNPSGFNKDAADLNGDGTISVTDVGALITKILTGE